MFFRPTALVCAVVATVVSLAALPASASITAPEPPSTVVVSPYGSSSLLVEYDESYFDGGSEVTSYKVEWDPNPGTREVQAITTTAYVGPNEIQQIETSYSESLEQKVVVTTAADVNEVQTITTYANRAETISGSFTVVFDMTDEGGTLETSAPISFDAAANGTDRTSVKEILEAMLNIGEVEVSREPSGVDDGVDGAFEWSITFLSDDNRGNIPQLRLGQSNLVATGVGVSFDTTTEGNEISGSYSLSFNGFTTDDLDYDATSAEVTAALVALDPISSVDVFRSGPDINRGYAWTITFTGEENAGDVGALTANSKLEGENATVFVCESGDGSGGCAEHESMDGNSVSGYITLMFDGNEANVSAYATASEMKTAFEQDLGTGSVSVTRTGPSYQMGYVWQISFLELAGDVDDIVLDLTDLDGQAEVTEPRKGTNQEIQEILVDSGGASFALHFDGTSGNFTTNLMTVADCDDASAIEDELEALANIGSIGISCNVTSGGDFAFTVDFLDNAGDLSELQPTNSTGGVSVSTILDGTSEPLGGYFTVSFDGQRTSFLPHDVSAIELKNALESLETGGIVDVARSDVDPNNGYTWYVTFLSVMDVSALLETDTVSLTGTVASASTSVEVEGEIAPFNSGSGGLSWGSTVITDTSARSMVIEDVEAGVPYFVRVTASNIMGYGAAKYSDPPFGIPASSVPMPPTDVTLEVGSSDNLVVTWNEPVSDGSLGVDEYRIEWFTSQIVEEVQEVKAIVESNQPTVQTISTRAVDIDEIQIVRINSTYGGVPAVEEQTIECDADSGCFVLSLNGFSSICIDHDASESEVESALQDISGVLTGGVSVTFDAGMTTICNAYDGSALPKATVELSDVDGFSGDIPLMTVDVTDLGGNKIVLVEESVAGSAGLSGTFQLSLYGETSDAIDVAAAGAGIATFLGSAATVTELHNDEFGVVVKVVFDDADYDGDIEDLDIDSSGLRGDGVDTAICAGGATSGVCSGLSREGGSISGTFTLTLMGYETDPIMYNAEDTSIKAALELLPVVGTVEVERTQVSAAFSYDWDVTFLSNPGCFPSRAGAVDGLTINSDNLNGIDSVNITVDEGSACLSGYFQLQFSSDESSETYTTSDLRYDTSAELLKYELEQLPNLAHVSVTRTIDDDGYAWYVTFSSCRNGENSTTICNVGNQRELVPIFEGTLTGNVTVSEVVAGTGGDAMSGFGSAIVSDLSGGAPYSYSIADLDSNEEYYVRVSAHNTCPEDKPSCVKLIEFGMATITTYDCCGWSSYMVSSPEMLSPENLVPGTMRTPTLVSSELGSAPECNIVLAWTHPTVTGGAAITGYELWMDDWFGGSPRRVWDGRDKPDVLSATVEYPLVRQNQQYVFTVRAVNSVGYGPFSDEATFTVRSPTASQPPPMPFRYTETGCSDGDARLVAGWHAPLDNGGSPITAYEVFVDDYASGSNIHRGFFGDLETLRVTVDTSSISEVTFAFVGATEVSDALNASLANASSISSTLESLGITFVNTVEQSPGVFISTLFTTEGNARTITSSEPAVVSVDVIQHGVGSPEVLQVTAESGSSFDLRRGQYSATIDDADSCDTDCFETAVRQLGDLDSCRNITVVADTTPSGHPQWTFVLQCAIESSETYIVDFEADVEVLQQGRFMHVESDLEPLQTVKFYVKAVNAYGTSNRSPLLSTDISNSPQWGDNQEPLSITALSSAQISMEWEYPNTYLNDECVSPIRGYKVYSYPNVLSDSNYGVEPVQQEIQSVTLVASEPQNEVQQVVFSNTTAGDLFLSVGAYSSDVLAFSDVAAGIVDIFGVAGYDVSLNTTVVGASRWYTVVVESFDDVPLLHVDDTNLDGDDVTVTEVVKGKAYPGGDFTLIYGGAETISIPVSASAEFVTSALSLLPTIETVEVSLEDLDYGQRQWLVTFSGEPGDLPLMEVTNGRLVGNNARVKIEEVVSGTPASLVYDGSDNPTTRKLSVDVDADTTYGFKVIAINSIGQGPLSAASPTIYARDGANAAYTTLSGSALSVGVAGSIFEEQVLYTSGSGSFWLSQAGQANSTVELNVGISGSELQAALRDLDGFDELRVSEYDTSLAGFSGPTYKITFSDIVGDVDLLEFSSDGTNVTGEVQEFVRGVSNTFVIEPRKASGQVVRDITVTSEFAGNDLFFVELWNSDPSVVDGTHDWYADGGLATYQPTIYEVQYVVNTGSDEFDLTFTFGGSDHTTASIPAGSDALDLQIALEDLDVIETVTVVSNGTDDNAWFITFTSNLGDLEALASSNEDIVVSEAVKGITEVQSIFNVASENCIAEVQMIRVTENCDSDFEFSVTFDDSDPVTLSSNMTAANVEMALEDGLSEYGVDVEVETDISDDQCNIFLVTFIEPVGDVVLLSASDVSSIYSEEISAGYSSISGTFVVQFGAETTENLPFDVSSGDLQTALNNLASLSASLKSTACFWEMASNGMLLSELNLEICLSFRLPQTVTTYN